MSEGSSLRKRNKQTIYQFRTDSEYQEGNGRPPKSNDLWRSFKGFTTIHGIPHITKARGGIKKIFWVVCLLACLTAFFYNLVYLFILYSKFYVNVRVQLLHNREMTFPAVTICNTNPVKSSAVYNSPRLVALLESWGVPLNTSGGGSKKKRSVGTYPDIKESIRLDDLEPASLDKPRHRSKRTTHDSSCSDIRYVTIEHRAISGNNDATFSNVASGVDCYDICSGIASCKSADYDVRGSQMCNVANADQYTATLTATGTANWDYYEKCEGCATGHPEPADTTRYCYSDFPDWFATYVCDDGKYWDSDGITNKTIKCSCETETWELISDTCEAQETTTIPTTTVAITTTEEEDITTTDSETTTSQELIETTSATSAATTEEAKADCSLAAPDVSAYDIITINSPGQDHGEVAYYECIPGLQLVDGDSQAMCNDGTWEFIPTGILGYCDYGFTIYTSLKSYDQAVKDCQQRGKQIVIIDSQAKLRQIQDLLRCRYHSAWIGLRYNPDNEVWQWENGEQMIFSHWLTGKPELLNKKEDCVRIINTGGNWSNRKCNRKYAYICEGESHPCTPSPCLNDGICCAVNDRPQCLCPKPFSGDKCQNGKHKPGKHNPKDPVPSTIAPQITTKALPWNISASTVNVSSSVIGNVTSASLPVTGAKPTTQSSTTTITAGHTKENPISSTKPDAEMLTGVTPKATELNSGTTRSYTTMTKNVTARASQNQTGVTPKSSTMLWSNTSNGSITVTPDRSGITMSTASSNVLVPPTTETSNNNTGSTAKPTTTLADDPIQNVSEAAIQGNVTLSAVNTTVIRNVTENPMQTAKTEMPPTQSTLTQLTSRKSGLDSDGNVTAAHISTGEDQITANTTSNGITGYTAGANQVLESTKESVTEDQNHNTRLHMDIPLVTSKIPSANTIPEKKPEMYSTTNSRATDNKPQDATLSEVTVPSNNLTNTSITNPVKAFSTPSQIANTNSTGPNVSLPQGATTTEEPSSNTTANDTTGMTGSFNNTVASQNISTKPINMPVSSEAPTTSTTTTSTTTPPPTTTTTQSTTTQSTTQTDPPTTTKAATSRFAERNENPLREDFKKEEDLMKVLADLDEETKKELGYTFNDMILDCQYEGTNCVEGDFDWFFDAVHGNCYVFNSGWSWPDEKEHFSSHRVGRRYGLKAVLNIGQYEYLQGIGESAGAVIVVHPVDRMPFPEDEGVLAVPGSGTAIGVKKVEVIRQPSPYGDCIETTSNFTRNVFEEMYPTRYSSNACFKTCYQRHVIEECGCADPQYPMTGEAFKGVQNVEACDIRDIKQDDCKYEITQKYIRDELDCYCPNPCHDVAFLYSVSSNMWPAEIQQESVIDSLGSSVDQLRAMNDSSVYRRNLLKIEVYFEEFNYEKIQEFPKYPLTKLFSDIGGIIGLWIGCSVISLAEFLELGLDFLILAIYKVSKKKYWGRSKGRRPGSNTAKSQSNSINPAASGNVLNNMNETSLNADRTSGSSGNYGNSQLGVAPATYGGFMSRRNSMRNLGSRQGSARGGSNMAGGISTGYRVPGIILEDVSEGDVANAGSGNPPESYSYYDDKKRKEKTHQSYLSRMTNLARKPLSSVKKEKSPPPPQNGTTRDNMPHVQGGLRMNLASMYEDDNDSMDKNSVRHRGGQFSEENPPFKFI